MNIKNERQKWMGVLAKAPAALLEELWLKAASTPEYAWLRAPETGGVMVQGRSGATGAPFNLGEMTVTRCALRLSSGEVGHGYVQGRSKRHAEIAALVDAMMQTAGAGALRHSVLEPLEQAAQKRRQARAQKAASTKVDFFTLVRGED